MDIVCKKGEEGYSRQRDHCMQRSGRKLAKHTGKLSHSLTVMNVEGGNSDKEVTGWSSGSLWILKGGHGQKLMLKIISQA